ncbi:MAG: hypothetical protein U1C47_03625 [Hydrogenophaga sp.]|nr:hypothetical protein [Hydrogenophaga sp.]
MTSQNTIILSENGISLEVHPHEYWYLAPSKTKQAPGELVRPLDFAFILNNAKLGKGVMSALDDLLAGITPSTMKGGSSRQAELLLEEVRREKFPDKPSRLRSYFLNYSREVAEARIATMFRGNRQLVRCHVILNSAKFHHADVKIFEDLTGRPDDQALAEQYWIEFKPNTSAEFHRLEVIADSMLYFPDWESFPVLDKYELAKCQWPSTQR